jgi:prefoldin subunit 5
MAQAAVASTERKVSELEGVVERLTGRVATFGDFKFQAGLDLAIAQLATVRARIEPYKAEAARLEAEIQALQPSQVEIEDRHERQREFASLAGERLEYDREAERLVKELRSILRTRSELTTAMATSAKLFDLADDALDASRVEKLLDSLPESIMPQSERWYGLFFGNSKTEISYVVIADSLVLPETFSSNGLLSFGDRVQLTEEGAREFLRKDRREPGARFSSDLLPPDIMIEDEFGLAVEAAKAKGHSVDWEVHSMHRDYCEKISKEWSRQKHIDLWGADNKTHPFLG